MSKINSSLSVEESASFYSWSMNFELETINGTTPLRRTTVKWDYCDKTALASLFFQFISFTGFKQNKDQINCVAYTT